MKGSSRRSRSQRSMERLETRWLFSLTVLRTAADASFPQSSHGGGCGCPVCGGMSGFVQVESMVYLPPGTKLSDDELAAIAQGDHGSGCSCPLCRGVLGNESASANDSAYGHDVLSGVTPQFETSGLKWSQPGGLGNPVNITYSLSNLLTSDLGGTLSAATVYDAVEEAFGLWAKYAPLNFKEVVDAGPGVSDSDYSPFNRPNIRIGHHEIDGGSNILAHAFFPDGSGRAGDVHLDSDESWTTEGSFSSIDIIEVMTHELGHSLGLDHEPSDDAIMNAFYSGRFDGLGTGFLLPDDIDGIRAIYGTGVGSVTPLLRNPVTETETFVMDEDGAIVSPASVLANDSDPQGGTLTAELAKEPAHGDVVFAANGTFTYTPDPNFFGEDVFTYRASNGTYQSSPTIVTLVVQPTLDLPTATPDSYSVRTGASFLTGRRADDVIAKGDVWRFLDDGSNQGAAWRETDFDESSWKSGRAQLGYGEGDEIGIVDFGGDEAQKHITTYFRKEFELSDTDRIDQLNLQLLRDDGAIVYLNGAVVARSNLTVSPNHLTKALVDITGSSESRYFNFVINRTSLPAGTLRAGRNVVAVELHQSKPNSDDLSFDLALSVSRDVRPDPTVNDGDLDRTGLEVDVLEIPAHGALTVEADGSIAYTPTPGFVGQDEFSYHAVSHTPATLVASGSNWRYLDTGADLGTSWHDPVFVEEGWKLGQAQLGYGDGDEGTSIEFGSDDNRFATTYFRKSFAVEDPTRVLSLAANVLRDDAAAIYFNGVEIYRDENLPANAGHADYTGDEVADEAAFVTFEVPLELLVGGENVLAVEIHQSSANDEDLSFDFSLTGQTVSAATTVTIEVTPTVTGDVNFDGVVDLNDLNLVRGNFGGDGAVLLGDSNGDGAIDLADLNAVRNNFGFAAPAPAPQTAAELAAEITNSNTASVARLGTLSSSQKRPAASQAVWDLALVDWLDGIQRPFSRSAVLANRKMATRA